MSFVKPTHLVPLVLNPAAFLCFAFLVTTGVQAEPTAAPQADGIKTGHTKADGTKAGPGKPDVATLLFDNPQWTKAPAGTTLDYLYSKKTAQTSFGPSFDDHIVLKLDKGDDADSRTAEVKMFSGMNAKPAGPFQSDKQNPVLLLVMEQNVQELSKIFKANPRYLKNAIRKAWRSDAKISDAQIDIGGKTVAGTKITVTPFSDDAVKAKMLGLDGMTYTVEIADSIPGNIASIDIRAPANGKAVFSETLRYQAEKK